MLLQVSITNKTITYLALLRIWQVTQYEVSFKLKLE